MKLHSLLWPLVFLNVVREFAGINKNSSGPVRATIFRGIFDVLLCPSECFSWFWPLSRRWEGVCEVEGLVEAVGLLLCPRASCGLGWGQELLEKYQPEAWRPRGTQRVYDRPSERTLVMLKKTPRSL